MTETIMAAISGPSESDNPLVVMAALGSALGGYALATQRPKAVLPTAFKVAGDIANDALLD